ncbi:MAG: PhnA domain-containing protein [Flavobacteriaceae bacterium]|nr:PhnA domain-containing protein [Flavobacteriaceae bacterium]
MPIPEQLRKRANGACELCGSEHHLSVYKVPPAEEEVLDRSVLVCESCKMQLEQPETIDPKHWFCLKESMWSEVDAVKVVSYRMLNTLKAEPWSAELLEMIYLDEATLSWANETLEGKNSNNISVHIDSNGNKLENGDTVVLIKDLPVKGANFVAKRGSVVKNIKLDADNSAYIEGKVNGQQIVILTEFVKRN